MKIAQLIDSYDKITGNEKKAFVPNPEVMQSLQQIQQMQQQIMQEAQTWPPEMQQQLQSSMEQLSHMPVQTQLQQLQMVMEQLGNQQGQQPATQQPQEQPQISQPAQGMQQIPPQQAQPQQAQPQQAQPQQMQQPKMADEKRAFGEEAMMGGGDVDPSMLAQLSAQQGTPQQQGQSGDEASANAHDAAGRAENELDNTYVKLTVRELLDLVGKGQATAALLKVKQMASAHDQKMKQNEQKMQMAEQQATADQQAQQQGLNTGGIYSQPMEQG